MKIFKKFIAASAIMTFSVFFTPIDGLAQGRDFTQESKSEQQVQKKKSNRCAIPMHDSTVSIEGNDQNQWSHYDHFYVKENGMISNLPALSVAFIESDGYAIGGGGSTIYLKKGGTFNGNGSTGNIIYYEEGSTIINPGGNLEMIRCDHMFFFTPEYTGPKACIIPMKNPVVEVDSKISNLILDSPEWIEFYETLKDSRHMIVKEGGDVSVKGTRGTYYLEKGAKFLSESHFNIYAKSGSFVETADNWNGNVIYHEKDVIFGNLEQKDKTVECDFIYFYPEN